MSAPPRNRMRAVYGLLVVAALFSACRAGEDASPAVVDDPSSQSVAYRSISENATYTGDQVCATCHEDEWSGFQSHGMANSYYPLTRDNLVEDFDVAPIEHPDGDWFYRPVATDSGYFQEEYRLNRRGEVDHRLLRRMDFVVGSGTAARTYMTDVDGRLYQMPLTWYTQNQRWDFSPGYEVGNKRFDRAIPDRCMACHNAYPETVPFVDGKYTEVPNGIGCERCHGPGSLHADERLVDEQAPDSIDYTIVNPVDLDLDRQLDVCQQCHLQTTVSLLRDGRGPFDFRPGLDLSEYVSLYYAEQAQEDAESIDVISHADRMKQSACFVGSLAMDVTMTCTTCHDPHQGFRAVGEGYFDRACQSCHPTESLNARFEVGSAAREQHASESAACSSCHMPKVQAEDVTHASFTDHWVRVVGEGEEESTSGAQPLRPEPTHRGTVLHAYFPSDSTRSDEPIYRGMSYIVLGKQRNDSLAMSRGRRLLEDALGDRRGSYPEAWSLLGWSRLAAGDTYGAINAIEEAIQIEGPVPERLNALAQALESTGSETARIEALYRQALEVQPLAADIRVNLGRFLETRNRIDEAVAEYRRATADSPTMAAAHYNLGTANLRLGNADEAERSLRQAIHLVPDYDQALGNLALLLASTDRKTEAGAMFRRALDTDPRSAVANANLATFYLGDGRAVEAVPLFVEAIRIDPEYIQARLNLAVAYFQVGDVVRARQQASEVIRREPSNRRAAEILAALE